MSCNRLEKDKLLADLGDTMDAHVEHCADCRERLRGYQQITRWIAAGRTARCLPPHWKARTLARVYAIPPPKRRSFFTGALMAAVVAALLLLLFLDRRKANTDSDEVLAVARRLPESDLLAHPQLAMQIVEDEGWRSSSQRPDASPAVRQRFVAHPGQVVHARALPAGSRYFEIRVYRGERDLLVRCPAAGPPVCVPAGDLLFAAEAARTPSATGRDPAGDVPSLLVWKIPSVSTYQVVFFVSQQPVAPPRGSLDDDVGAATAAGGRVIEVETIHVR